MPGMTDTVVYKTDMIFLHLTEFVLQLGKPKENKHSNKYFNHSKYREENTQGSLTESKEQERLFREIIFKLRLRK